jgi:hypothetical protein
MHQNRIKSTKYGSIDVLRGIVPELLPRLVFGLFCALCCDSLLDINTLKYNGRYYDDIHINEVSEMAATATGTHAHGIMCKDFDKFVFLR